MNIDNTLRSLNNKINKVAQELGKDSLLYKSYETRLNMQFGENNLRKNSKGVLQVKRGKNVNKLTDIDKKIEVVNRLPSYGKKKAQTKRNLQAEGIKNPTKSQILQRIKEQDEFKTFLDENNDVLYGKSGISKNQLADSALEMLRQKGKKTYAQLKEIREITKRAREEPERMENLFKDV